MMIDPRKQAELESLERQSARQMAELQALREAKKRKAEVEDPTSYGLPDLLAPMPYVSEEERVRNQNRALKEMIEKNLWIEKDGMRKNLKLIPEMLRFIADMFYQRTNLAIVWKPRGGGGSLAAALVIWLYLVYRSKSWLDLGGSKFQSQVVYEYVSQFWKCIKGMEDRLVVKRQITNTELANGASLVCVACSEKQIRGQHRGGIICDESSVLPDAMVLGDMLWRRADSFKTGDKVMSGCGRVMQNQRAWSREYNGWAVSVKVRGFPWPLKLTAEHLVQREDGWIHANCVKEGEWLVLPIPKRSDGLHELEFNEWSKGKAQRITATRRVEMNEEFYRWLGYWVGDGSYVKRESCRPTGWLVKMTTHSDDSVNASDFARLAMRVFGKHAKVYKKPRENAVDVTISSKGLWELISPLGKRDERRVPSDWLTGADDACIAEFIRGYLRADGYEAKSNYAEVRLSTISPGLMAAVQYCSWRLGYVPVVAVLKRERYGVKNHDAYELRWNGRSAKELALLAWGSVWDSEEGTTRWRYDREGDRLLVQVRDVERFLYRGPVYDIEMPSPDFSFMAGGVSVHNCQKDEGTSVRFEAAMQGMFSEPDPLAALTSTFHHPFGFFQEYWDGAKEKGFRQYKWNIFETMSKCEVGLKEYATKEDPLALKYCRERCPLTERKEVKDGDGKVIDVIYEECAGQARHSDGFGSFENILMAKRMNSSGNTWKIEFVCDRPRIRGHVYSTDKVEGAIKRSLSPRRDGGLLTVGLDWGLLSQAFAVLVAEAEDGRLSVTAGKAFDNGESAQDIGAFIKRWQAEYGKLVVYGDAEETYGNQQLMLDGLEVVPVHFGKWKQQMVTNLNFWFDYNKIDILDEGDLSRVLVPQLKKLHRSRMGIIQKVDDHGPDSLGLAALPFDFLEMAGNSIGKGLRQQKEVDEYTESGIIDEGL